MSPAPNAAAPRQYQYPQMQATLPYRTSHGIEEFNEMGLDGIGMEPGLYLMSRGFNNTNEMLLATSDMQLLSVAMAQTDPATANYSIPSSCGSLTEDATLDTAISGQQSDGFNDNISVPVDMAHTDSRGSYLGQHGTHSMPTFTQSYDNGADADMLARKAYFGSDDDVRGTGSKYLSMGQIGHPQRSISGQGFLHGNAQAMERTESVNTFSSFGLNPSPEADTFAFQDYADSQHYSADMERSTSSTSARSNLSLRIRAKTSLRRQLDNASKIHLQPKMSAPMKPAAKATLLQLSPQNAAQDASAGDGTNNGKVEISKAKRERPKTKKLFCDLCMQCPAGFRGEHELRRHKSSKHGTTFKKWICRDPRDDSVETSVEAIRPLNDCKHCREGKTYGIYYNAGAHLRRTHFKEKAPRKGSNRTPSVDSSGADADSSVDWPPMNELKKWMVEITVSGDQLDSVTEADDADEAADDECIEDEETSFNEDTSDLAATSTDGNISEDTSLQNYTFFGMGYVFPSDAAMSIRGGDRGAPHSTDLQAEMPRPDGFQPMYTQGPISSANFLEPQSNLGHLFPELLGFNSSDIVSSPSGTTVTQGTAHPFSDQPLEPSRFEYSQTYANGDSLDFDYLSLGAAI